MCSVQGHVTGNKILRVVRPSVFETRSLVHLSNKRSRSHRRSQKLWASPFASHARTQGRGQDGVGGCIAGCESFNIRDSGRWGSDPDADSGTPTLMPTRHKKVNVESHSPSQKPRKRRLKFVPRSASKMHHGASKRQIKSKKRYGN